MQAGTAEDDRTESEKRLYSSPDEILRQTLCPAKEHPELGLCTYDPKTGAKLPGKTPASLTDLSCHEGTCPSCPGHHGVCAARPVQSVDLPRVTGAKAVAGVEARGANLEHSGDEFTWHEFKLVTREGGDGGVDDDPDHVDPSASAKATARTSTLWLPVTGTRRQFMAYLHATFRSYREHVWGVRWQRQTNFRLCGR